MLMQASTDDSRDARTLYSFWIRFARAGLSFRLSLLRGLLKLFRLGLPFTFALRRSHRRRRV